MKQSLYIPIWRNPDEHFFFYYLAAMLYVFYFLVFMNPSKVITISLVNIVYPMLRFFTRRHGIIVILVPSSYTVFVNIIYIAIEAYFLYKVDTCIIQGDYFKAVNTHVVYRSIVASMLLQMFRPLDYRYHYNNIAAIIERPMYIIFYNFFRHEDIDLGLLLYLTFRH